MGKNKKRNRRRRQSHAARIQRQYANSWRNKNIETALNADECHEKQSKHHKAVAERERDILSRSIFVTCVRDLNVEANLKALERFFTYNYGQVRQCVRTKFPKQRRRSNQGRINLGNRFPPARVVFYHKQDAEKVFGGTPLFQVKRNIELVCPVGHKNGKIMVKPCMPSNDLLEDDTRGSEIKLSVSEILIGHWCPAELEMDDLKKEGGMDVWLGVDGGAAPAMTIDMKKRCIFLTSSNLTQTFRLTFRFKQLSSPMKLCQEQSGKYSMVFALKHPPQVHRMDESALLNGILGIDHEPEYERSPKWENLSATALGLCLGYKLVLTEDQIRDLLLHKGCNQLCEFGVVGFDLGSLQNPNPIQSQYVGYDYDDAFDADLLKIAEKSFRLASTCSVLKDSGRFTAYHAVTDKVKSGRRYLNILDLLKEVGGRSRVKMVVQRLENILAGFGYTKHPCRLLSRMLEGGVLEETQALPPHCLLMPRMRVSPLRTICTGYDVETSNRAIRHFASEEMFALDMFLRVTITDEDGGQFHGSELTSEVRTRVENALLNGVTLCGRKFVFLAYSSSQLKECSAWMVCLPPGWTVARMRNQLGNFSSCTTASKYGARLGQCFSTTFTDFGDSPEAAMQRSLQRSTNKPVTIPDIESVGGCHSDGNGIIRRDVLDEILLRIAIGPKDRRDASIIQIRFGGAKGTLTAFDDPGRYLTNAPRADVYLRPSMIKFTAAYNDIEVCSVGKRVPYYLNRNVILLLASHGVPQNTFLSLQKKMLDDLDNMLTDLEVAKRLVPALSGPENEQRMMLLHMIFTGLAPLQEPFLYDCLSSIRNHHLFSLRKKSRIWVEKGAVLVGGIDITAQLPEGCVFFQVDSKPFVGPVLVTKHPVMHPGDVRMLQAVDVPELRGHRNVILFSQHGARPEADKMSGSDLDGDEFAVCYDSRLFIPRNREPMDYAGSSKVNLNLVPDDPHQISDALVKHFLDHIKNASLGQIAMLWLDHAAAKGADCAECIELAGLHSDAVDYPKSGIPAVVLKHLKLHPDTPRPHWREKKNSPSFHCHSIIGLLYDQVTLHERQVTAGHKHSSGVAGRKVDKYGTIICEVHKPTPVHNRQIPLALRAHSTSLRLPSNLQQMANDERALYEMELLLVMSKYKIRSEGETYTGCIRKFHKLHKRRQADFTQEVRRQYGELRAKFRKSFFEHVIKIAAAMSDQSDDLNAITVGLASMQFEDADEFDDEAETPEAVLEELLGSDDDESDAESLASVDDEKVRSVELAVTKELMHPVYGSGDDVLLQRVAFALAAAYYDSVYHPEHRWSERDRQVCLFSFPWLVADVIGLGCCSTPP